MYLYNHVNAMYFRNIEFELNAIKSVGGCFNTVKDSCIRVGDC